MGGGVIILSERMTFWHIIGQTWLSGHSFCETRGRHIPISMRIQWCALQPLGHLLDQDMNAGYRYRYRFIYVDIYRYVHISIYPCLQHQHPPHPMPGGGGMGWSGGGICGKDIWIYGNTAIYLYIYIFRSSRRPLRYSITMGNCKQGVNVSRYWRTLWELSCVYWIW